MNDSFSSLHHDVIHCERCKRLREYCLGVARDKRRAYADYDYWGLPVPGFGDPAAWLWIVGLAPGAHGANRTGRDDGLKLSGCYISAAARCAPPGNKPLPEELADCSAYIDREWKLLRRKRVILALGRIAWDAALALAQRNGCPLARLRPTFGHGAVVELLPNLPLVGSYHVSQQNTFTGRLTPEMLDDVIGLCRVRR